MIEFAWNCTEFEYNILNIVFIMPNITGERNALVYRMHKDLSDID